MVRSALVAVLALVMLSKVHAQDNEKIVVKSGEDISAVLSSYGMYHFPAFADGLVSFRGGNTAAGKMNYNIYLNLLQFIDEKGDTLAISNQETIDSATIGNTVFYYRNGLCQVIENYGGFELVMKQQIEFTPVKNGAFGLPANGTGAQTYESMSTGQVINSKLSFNEDIIVRKQTAYLLFYQKYRQETATARGFSTLYPAYKTRIEASVKDNRINFSKLDDLKKLAAFCAAQRP